MCHNLLHLLLRKSHLTLLTCTSTSSNLDLHAQQVALPGSHATAMGTTTSVVRYHELHKWDLGSNHHITSSWCGGLRDPEMTIYFTRSLKRKPLRKACGITKPGLKKNARCCAKGLGGQRYSAPVASALQGAAVGSMCRKAMPSSSSQGATLAATLLACLRWAVPPSLLVRRSAYRRSFSTFFANLASFLARICKSFSSFTFRCASFVASLLAAFCLACA